MPSSTLQRTLRRIGATVTILLSLIVLYVRELYVRQWGVGDVAPAILSVGLPTLVVAVSLGYLTLSLLRGVARRIEASAPDSDPDGNPGDDTAGG